MAKFDSPRPLEHISCMEVLSANNALEYLKMRKNKMQNTPIVGAKLQLAIREVEMLLEENRLYRKVFRQAKTAYFVDLKNQKKDGWELL